MSEINTSSALDKILSDYALPPKKNEGRNELGKDAFLRLLVAQLENQDPTNPQENGEFIAQLAQFSQLEETQKMTASFEQFSDAFQSTQHLQATSLVGRPVHVATDATYLGDSNAVSVIADLPAASGSVGLSVYNGQGEMVDFYDLGTQPSGRNEFIWTGKNAEDERFPPGNYSFRVTASNGGETSEVPLFLSANVNSVTIEKNGSLTLNLAGLGPKSMSDVIQIN